jgi:hypothetical protein
VLAALANGLRVITPLFQKYGTVVTYDTEGRRTGPE